MTGDSAVTDDLPRELARARFSDLYRDHARDLLGYALRRSADPDERPTSSPRPSWSPGIA